MEMERLFNALQFKRDAQIALQVMCPAFGGNDKALPYLDALDYLSPRNLLQNL
jgi:hypothetical protein